MREVREARGLRERILWLTEDEAFTLLMALVRGAAAGSASEEALLEKFGLLCRAFLRDGDGATVRPRRYRRRGLRPREATALARSASG